MEYMEPSMMFGVGRMHTEPEVETDSLQQMLMSDANSQIERMAIFFNQSVLSDVTIKVGEQTYFGHKFVLAYSSDVLQTMLYEKRWNGPTDEITLKETEDCQAVFHPFLKYLYTAKIQLNLANIIGVLCLADKYNIESLKQLCQSYMIAHSASPRTENIQNAMHWYPWSKALHLNTLKNSAKSTIAWNARNILTSDDWLNMDMDFLRDMLCSSDLIVQSELDVFKGVERWILHHTSQDIKDDVEKDAANQLLSLVRFPRMTITELQAVEQSDLMEVEAQRDIITSHLGNAYRFHSLCMAPIENIQKQFSDKDYEPRDYLEYQVDSIGIHNTSRYAMQVEVKTCASPLPALKKEADWKVSYRKTTSSGAWSLQVQCLDNSMNSSGMFYDTTILVFNSADKVIQVFKPERAQCKRGQPRHIEVAIDDATCKTLMILIKPVVNSA